MHEPDFREDARRLLADLGRLTEEARVEHLAAGLQVVSMRERKRLEREYRGAAENAAGRIVRKLREGASVIRGAEPDAALALDDYATRIARDWELSP